MATKTPNLGLIKPAFKEFNNSWNVPVNSNWDILDVTVGSQALEIQNARGSASDLATRLAVALNADGSLQDVPEVARARVSSVYGDSEGSLSFALRDRIERGDRESFTARQSLDSLIDALAYAGDDDVSNSVQSAPGGFLSFTGAQVKVDGSVTPVIANINGYRQVVRKQISATISGAAATYYLYLQRNSAGETILDRTGGGQNTGQVSTWTLDGKLRKFSDSSQNFVTLGIKVGDILTITTNLSPNADVYVVAATNETNPSDLTVNEVAVIGTFVSAQTSLNYSIVNPIAPTLSFTGTAHAKRFARASGLIYIGRAVFDGANVTSVSTYAVKGRFEQFFSITLTGGDFAQTISHSLGFIPSKLEIYASQASDYSVPIEPLSVASATTATLQRSVIVDLTDTTLRVKNATNGIYYKDYAGVSQTSGFLLVRAER